jgi:hypothetical protein
MKERAPEKKIETSEVDLRGSGRKLWKARASGANLLGTSEQTDPRKPSLIEKMLERGNLLKALQAVERNGGAAGTIWIRNWKREAMPFVDMPMTAIST